MQERTGILDGWVGPWIAFSVLLGWRLWVATSAWIPPTGAFLVAGAGSALVVLLMVLPLRRGAGVPGGRRVLLLWILVGGIAGGRATHPVPPADRELDRILDRGQSSYHALQVVHASGTRWRGWLFATLSSGEWELLEPALPVSGRIGFQAKGAWIARGVLRRGWKRLPTRTTALDLSVERAFRLSEVPGRESWRTRLEQKRDQWRHRAVLRWTETLGSQVGPFAGWVLLGVRPPDAESLREPFVRTGTAHLLAISGLHVGIVAAAVWSVLRMVLRRPSLARRWTAVLLLCYAALTGGAVSVLRSAGMFLLLALGPAWGRLGRGWNALGWAAALLPVVWPVLPSRAAYLLSVGATAGVLLGARAGTAWSAGPGRSRFRRLGRTMFPTLTASLGAQIATWGLSLQHFALVSGTGLLFNLAAIPLAGVTVPLLLLAGLTSFHPAVGPEMPVIVLARFVAETLLRTVLLVSRVGQMWIGTVPEPTTQLLAAAALTSLWALVRIGERGAESSSAIARPNSRGPVGLLLTGLCLLFGFLVPSHIAQSSRPPEGGVRATFLDVGQGDAILLEMGDTVWLYDTGPPYPRRLVRSLLAAGVSRVDRVFVTHGDLDHWGGLSDLLASPIRVDTLSISAAGAWPDRFWDELGRTARGDTGSDRPRAVPRVHPVVERVGAGWCRTWGLFRWRVLHPEPGFCADGRNDHSIVLRLEDSSGGAEPGHGRLLLIGDLESPGQERLLGGGASLDADVSQAGHHGSRTSLAPGWYEAVRPGLVVASLASENRYGFPHPLLQEQLDTLGIPLTRTDRMGAIGVAWDGRSWDVRTGGDAPWIVGRGR